MKSYDRVMDYKALGETGAALEALSQLASEVDIIWKQRRAKTLDDLVPPLVAAQNASFRHQARAGLTSGEYRDTKYNSPAATGENIDSHYQMNACADCHKASGTSRSRVMGADWDGFHFIFGWQGIPGVPVGWNTPYDEQCDSPSACVSSLEDVAATAEYVAAIGRGDVYLCFVDDGEIYPGIAGGPPPGWITTYFRKTDGNTHIRSVFFKNVSAPQPR